MPVAVSGQLERLGQPSATAPRWRGSAPQSCSRSANGAAAARFTAQGSGSNCVRSTSCGRDLVTGVENDPDRAASQLPGVQRQGEFHHSRFIAGGWLLWIRTTDLGGQLPKLRLGKCCRSGPRICCSFYFGNPHWPSMRPPIQKGRTASDSVGGRRARKPGRRLIVIARVRYEKVNRQPRPRCDIVGPCVPSNGGLSVVSTDSDALDAARMLAVDLNGLWSPPGGAGSSMRYSLPHRSCASSCYCKTIATGRCAQRIDAADRCAEG